MAFWAPCTSMDVVHIPKQQIGGGQLANPPARPSQKKFSRNRIKTKIQSQASIVKELRKLVHPFHP